jgi:drug/metabolite transporter (DMT)-like permease
VRLRVSPYLLLALANLFWAGNWIVGRAFRDTVPPIALSFWRWAIALAFILPLAWPHLRQDGPRIAAGWRWTIPFGVLGTACYNALAYVGLQYTTVINGLLLNSFIPIVIALLAWTFQGKTPRRAEAVGIAASCLGVAVIVARGDPAVLAGLRLNAGDLWILVSVVAWATYTLLLPKRPALHPMSFLAIIAGVGLACLAPFYGWEIAAGRAIVPTPAALAGIAYTGIIPAFLGFLFWNRGVAETNPARAGLFMHLMPVFGIVLSMIFLGERPAPYHFAGIALIFGGIWLNTRTTT